MLRQKKPLMRKTPLGASRAQHGKRHSDPAADAGRRLWSLLETSEVAGLTFRQHERIGPYMVDFVCPAARLVLLLSEGGDDGGRAAWFAASGYRVLEFPIGEVLADPAAVIETVARSFELRIVPPKS